MWTLWDTPLALTQNHIFHALRIKILSSLIDKSCIWEIVNNAMKYKLLIISLIAITLGTVAYAAQTVNDRVEIDNDDGNITLDNGDLFGYQIEAIGDLDNDGVIDLATIKFSDDTGEANVGSILILFMNENGSVKGTNEIIMDNTAGNLAGCLGAASLNRDNGSLEQLAFVGDLDNDGEPTLALGANSNDHYTGGGVIVDSGAVYMLELNSDGTVDNCVLITEDNGGFAPADGVYLQNAAANFGWPLIATDLNGDGQNELIVGAGTESNDNTALWPLFLSATGTVASHPAVPITGATIGIDGGSEYIDDGASISGTKIVVSNQDDGDGGGSVFIVNLSSTGAFVSSTEIAGSTIAGIANDERFGSGVTGLGDMDADGINDILVGNAAGDDTNALSGEVHILYLNADDTLKESQSISNISENTRTTVSPFAASDLFGHGMTVWRDSGSNAIIAISAHQDGTGVANSGAIHLFYVTRAESAVTASTGGDSDGAHKSKPTFGIDHKTFLQKVDFGLTINDESFVVDDNYWTEIPMQNLTVGEIQNFTSKVYAPHQLNVMEFLFGIPEVGMWDDAEASIAIHLDYSGEFDKIVWNNNLQIINEESFSFSSMDAFCGPDDIIEQCTKVSIELEFKESPTGKVLALQAIDQKRRSNILYFNDGMTVYGESLNPPFTKQIISEIKYKGLQTIQRIDKVQDIWITLDEKEPVSLYQQNDHGTFIALEYRIFEKIPDKLTTNIDRLHSEFVKLKQFEISRATNHFDSSKIVSELPTFLIYNYIQVDMVENINDNIESEKIRTLDVRDLVYKNHKKVVQNFDN